MTTTRVLHVDDEPDIREIVQLSLSLDRDLRVRSCGSGADALTEAARWSPDLILLDVMMPGMDGPATLGRLRENPRTATIPVVFMTARAQPRELEHFVSLGAEGVIAKPFDPITLAASVRNYLGGVSRGVAARRTSFLERTREQGRALAAEREAVADPAQAEASLERIRGIAHSISGAAGIFGFAAMSREASELETAVIARLEGKPSTLDVEQALSALIARIASA